MTRDYKAELLLNSVVHDTALLAEVASRFDGDVFETEVYNTFLSALGDFFDEYRKVPTLADFRAFVPANQYVAWDAFARDVFATPEPMNHELVRNRLYANWQRNEAMAFIERTVDGAQVGFDMTRAYADMRALVLKTSKPLSTCIELTRENITEHYRYARDFRHGATGPLIFEEVNKMCGGVASRELVLFIAPPSRGKTLYLINELHRAPIAGERTLYLTMENEKPSIVSRYADRILLMRRRDQRRDPAYAESCMRKYMGAVKPPLIMYQPANTFTVDDLDLWIEEWQEANKEKIDRVIVDYMNKFKKRKSFGKAAEWDDIRTLSDDLRAMAVNREAKVISAAQTNRSGIANDKKKETESVNETMIQGGFGQFETADIVFAYSETKTEKAAGTARITMLKNRDAGGRGREFVVVVAPHIQLMTDCIDQIIPAHKQADYLQVHENRLLPGLTAAPVSGNTVISLTQKDLNAIA